MAYLEITLKVSSENRPAAAGVYNKYKEVFLKEVNGAKSKELLIRDEDVQVLHGFGTVAELNAYLQSDLFNQDVVVELKPHLDDTPEVRIYDVA